MIPNYVYDRREGTACVMEVGGAIEVTGSEMQQGHRRSPRHACEAIGGSGGHALEQAQHRTDPRLPVERRNKMHLTRARIGETRRHAAVGHSGIAAIPTFWGTLNEHLATNCTLTTSRMRD
jgi:hypothetical protein